MKPLILTGSLIPEFTRSDFADLAVDFHFRFVWGPLPAPDELANYLGARTSGHGPGRHWSDFAFRGNVAKTGGAGMLVWPSSASNTRPSNCGSISIRTLSC